MALFVSTDKAFIESTEILSFSVQPFNSANFSTQADNEKPPLTNQGGVNDKIPPENRSLLDWLSFTVKQNDPYEALGIIGLQPSLFSELPYGFSGYRRSLRFGDISIFYAGREDMGCLVNMTGQGCRQFESQFNDNPWLELIQNAFAANVNFTRLDLALDNVNGALTLDRIWTAIDDHEKQVRSRFSEWKRMQTGSFCEGKKITGETIYLGSAKSHTLFRVYNKAQQLGLDGHWIRFELRLRDKRAQEGLKLFLSGVPVGKLSAGIINNDDSNKSRCSLQLWWAEWLESTEKIRLTTEKTIKYVSDSMEFMKRQCAPTLAMINQHLGAAPFKMFLGELVDNGRNRMGAKHERILAASAKGARRKGGNHAAEE